MALKIINVGSFVNDGTGDDLRTAFTKVNENFDELELQQGQNNTISNVGTGIGIYKEKIGVNLRLKSLKSGNGINIVASENEITISNTGNSVGTITANTGSLVTTSPSQNINILGNGFITTSVAGNTLTISGSGFGLINDPSPVMSGNLDLNTYTLGGVGNISVVGTINGTTINSNNHTGNLNGTVYGIDVRSIYQDVYIIDFGKITVETAIQLLMLQTTVDMGSFFNPSTISIEGGSIV